MKTVSLETVINEYHNQNVIDRFVSIYGIETQQVSVIFNDVKRWLWLAYETKVQGIENKLVIDYPIIIIDEMWHNFILFSKDYCHFCKTYFEGYIHHTPNTEKAELQLTDEDKQEIRQARINMKKWQYEFIYDHLGKETFLRWYREYPEKYTPSSLVTMMSQVLDKKQQ